MTNDIYRLCRVGRFQWMILLLASFITAPGNFANIGILFLAPNVDFSCQPKQFDKLENDQIMGINKLWPQCKQPPEDILSTIIEYANESTPRGNLLEMTGNLTSNLTEEEWVTCESHQFHRVLFTWTLTERFDLVCARGWFGPLLSTIFMAGYFLGGIVSGSIADRFGRKCALMLGFVLMIISNLLGAFAPIFELFCLARFLVAISDTTTYNAAYVIAMEILRKEERILAICLVTLCWVLSACTMAGVSSVLPNYQHMLLFLSGLSMLALVLSFFIVPESPRWLSSKGKKKELDDVIKQIAKFNNQEESELNHLRKMDEKEADVTPWVLLKTPLMRKRTIVQWIVWLSVVLVNYGILYNLGDFGNDIRQSTVFSSLMELPGWVLVMIMMAKIGRQISQFTMGLLAGVCFLATAPLLEHKGSMLLLVLALLGKACAANQLTICFTHTPELYPTQCRSLGLGASSTIGRVSGMVAPLLVVFNQFWSPALPVILGVVSLLTILLVPFLPDTTSHELAQNIEDGETFLADHRYKLVLPPDNCCRAGNRSKPSPTNNPLIEENGFDKQELEKI